MRETDCEDTTRWRALVTIGSPGSPAHRGAPDDASDVQLRTSCATDDRGHAIELPIVVLACCRLWFSLIEHSPSHHGEHDPRTGNRLGRDRSEVAVDHDEIGKHAGFEHADG